MNKQTRWPMEILLRTWILSLVLLTYYAGYGLGQLTGWHITFQCLAVFCVGVAFAFTLDPEDSPLSLEASERICRLITIGSVLQAGMGFFLDGYLGWPTITALVIWGIVLILDLILVTMKWANNVWK